MNFANEAAMEGLSVLAAFRGITLAQILRDGAVMFARYLATATPPFTTLPAGPGNAGGLDGGTLRARDVGRAAVRRDIGRVYISPSRIYDELSNWQAAKTGRSLANGYYRALKTGQIEEARSILRRAGSPSANLEHMAWDGGALHRKKQNKRGHINRGNRPAIVTDRLALKKYVVSIEKNVGFTKSGWITAASQISTRGLGQINGWIKTHRAPGYGEDRTENTAFPTIYLTNAVPWINHAIGKKFLSTASRSFEVNLAQMVQAGLDYYLRKNRLAA
jgi:hypothetical protein